MRILLDENIPVAFAAELSGHDVDTVTGVGWAGVKNGKLLSLASENPERQRRASKARLPTVLRIVLGTAVPRSRFQAALG